MRFFGLNITQHDDFTSTIDGDQKLQAIEPYPLSRVRCRQCDEVMNAIERSSFMSINASIGWLGITAFSSLCISFQFLATEIERRTCLCFNGTVISTFPS